MTEQSDDLEFASLELATIGEFLQQLLPFNLLDKQALQTSVQNMLVHYHCHGETFDESTPGKGLRVLRSGAVELRDQNSKLLDRLGEGESFHIAGLNAGESQVRATVIEDALFYFLPDEHYTRLRGGNREFDRYFGSQRSRRLRRAARYEPAPNAMTREVRSLMSSNLLTVSPADSVQEVASRMSERRFSAAFVVEGEALVGIVTDRDIRQRFAAMALPAQTPVREIMTSNPESIDGTDSVFTATLLMTQRGYHHLPVLEGDRLKGMLTTSDLILARQEDPVYLVQHISRQSDIGGIKELVAGMPNLMVQWVNSGIRTRHVSQILTAVSDAITVRLIQLAEEKLGPPPVRYCWLGFGSQARAEQFLGADQDNGLVISDEMQPEHRQWFTDMATMVCDGLSDCGYAYCPGGIMATTEEWRQPLAGWQQAVRRWTESPTPDAVMRVSIFFDLRSIYGDESLCQQLQSVMLQQASSNTIFLAHLAANALAGKPPLGIFRRFVVDRDGEHRDSLDIKKRGVLPVTDIVRLHALANRVTAVNTDDRLSALAKGKHLTIVDSRNLADALHCIQYQRIIHQAEEVVRGNEVSNFLNPRSLPRLAREQLRDAFTVIDEAQSAVRQTYRQGMG